MNHVTTVGIVLSRTNYGEADRIMTMLTTDQGKVRFIAKGARKPKSKLAAGVELFCVSHVSLMVGRSDLATLTSARLQRQFSHITGDIDRTMYGYEVIKCLATITEDDAGKEYFDLLSATLEALDDTALPLAITSTWFDLHVLNLMGHQPNLHTDVQNKPLQQDEQYLFSYDDMSFVASPAGTYGAPLIKLLRLAIAVDNPCLLANVSGVTELLPDAKNLANTMRKQTLRV